MATDQKGRTIQQRKERRAIPPFGDGTDPNAISNILDNILRQCRFSPFGAAGFTDHDTYFISRDEAHTRIEPLFEILLDRSDELRDRLGLQENDLEVGLSVRSSHLRRYAILERWSIDSVPSEPWSPAPTQLDGFRSGRGMDFVVAVRVVAHREELATRGLTRGKVLCRKEFSIKESIDALTFPFRWVEFGGKTEYPAEALWVIHWDDYVDDGGLARPVDQVLTVLVNKRAEGPLRAMSEVPGVNDMAWRMLAADITTQIWADVLTKTDYEPEENDTETLVGQVFARLSRASGMSYVDIKELARQDDSRARLRSIVAKILKVVR